MNRSPRRRFRRPSRPVVLILINGVVLLGVGIFEGVTNWITSSGAVTPAPNPTIDPSQPKSPDAPSTPEIAPLPLTPAPNVGPDFRPQFGNGSNPIIVIASDGEFGVIGHQYGVDPALDAWVQLTSMYVQDYSDSVDAAKEKFHRAASNAKLGEKTPQEAMEIVLNARDSVVRVFDDVADEIQAQYGVEVASPDWNRAFADHMRSIEETARRESISFADVQLIGEKMASLMATHLIAVRRGVAVAYSERAGASLSKAG